MNDVNLNLNLNLELAPSIEIIWRQTAENKPDLIIVLAGGVDEQGCPLFHSFTTLLPPKGDDEALRFH